MVFGQRLEQLLIEKDIQQSELATFLSVGDSTVSQWKTGKRSPDIETVKRIARFLNCTTDYLLGESDARKPLPHPEPKQGGLDFSLSANKNLGEDFTEEDLRKIEKFIQMIRKRELSKPKNG